MPYTFKPHTKKHKVQSFEKLYQPTTKILPHTPTLKARGDRPLQMDFEDQLKALIFFHLEEHTSGRELLQFLEEDDFAREHVAPEKGIKKSSFFEAINTRGLEQLKYVFEKLQPKAKKILPQECSNLGELVAIDGSLINATLSMHWADYRTKAKKAKVHIGFDINRAIPAKIFLTSGKGPERPFVEQILSPGQTGIMDRGYQAHELFDRWQKQKLQFVCRIKAKTKKKCLEVRTIKAGSSVFYDAIVLLGTPNVNQTKTPLRLVGYEIDHKKFWIATNRYDLSAEDIAVAYKLRWNIETFFAWWKRHLKVYHLIARSEYGLMVQILAGLITYLLLAIYCHDEHNEKVSIKRVRELRIKIQNEARALNENFSSLDNNKNYQEKLVAHAKT
jgi:hypothetical protein